MSYHGKHIIKDQQHIDVHNLLSPRVDQIESLVGEILKKKYMAMSSRIGIGNILNCPTWNEQQMELNEMSVKIDLFHNS